MNGVWRWLFSVVFLMLSGCGVQEVSVTSSKEYNEKIGDVTYVLVNKFVDADANKQTVNQAYSYKSGVRSLGGFYNAAGSGLNNISKKGADVPYLVKTSDLAFARGGYRKVSLPKGAEWPRHFITVVPMRDMTICTMTCKTTLKVVTSVYDRVIDREVWSSTLMVTEKSGLHTFGDDDFAEYWSKVTDQMKASGLI